MDPKPASSAPDPPLGDALLDELSRLKWRAGKLNQRASLLQAVLDALDAGLAVFDDNLRLAAWNRRFLALVDLPREAVETGISALDVLRHCARGGRFGPGDPEPLARGALEALRAPGRGPVMTLTDGRAVEMRRFDLPDGGLVAMLHDSSPPVAPGEAHFRHFAEATTDWYWELDAELRFTYVTERFEAIAGLRRERLYGRTHAEIFAQYVPAADLADEGKWRRHYAALASRRPYRDLVYRWQAGRDEPRTFRSSGIPVFDAGGGFLGYRGVGTDITTAARIEKALAEQTGRLLKAESLLQDAIDALPDGFMLWDAADRLVMVNEAFRRSEPEWMPPMRVGARYADLLEARVRAGAVPDALGREEDYVRERLALHANPGGEPLERRLADGRWMEIREHRTREGGIVSFRRDITERKRAEEELARHRWRLEDLVAERTRELAAAQRELLRSERLAVIGQLTGTVSHELRNPLGTIRSSFSILRRHLEVSHGPVSRAIERIDRSIDRCVTIIDELLDYTRLRELHLQPVALDAWLTSVLDDEEVPDAVTVRFDCRSDATVPVDRERLRRAVLNVFQNACQAIAEGADPPGHGEITVSTRASGGQAAIRVSDNGPGIPAGIRERIFEPLFSTKSFGVGLGLPLVRQVLEQHGGDVAVHSRDGEGTSIVLTLPLDAAGGDPPPLR